MSSVSHSAVLVAVMSAVTVLLRFLPFLVFRKKVPPYILYLGKALPPSIIGMLVILAVCVSPYLMLGSHYLVYQIAGGFASSFGDQRIGGVIRCIGDVFGFLLGIVGCVSVMLFVSVISLMKAVTPG